MIDSKKLLTDLQKQVTRLEDDLRARCNGDAAVDAPLKADYEAAKTRGRTALTYSAWRDEELTQVAVAWVLACVFVRFLEDNELIEVPFLAGPGARLQRAKDEHELFFRAHPTQTEREYFERVFTEIGQLPAMREFFDHKHNPLWRVGPSGDAARGLLDFWRKTDPETGRLGHDFTDPDWNTRFLGDLYQELSEAAQKKYALLQTPEFVEEFILDRTLTPAIQAFTYQVVRMIDPTCGSGHFCLGGFHRLFRIWSENQPGENPRVLAQKALDGVYGVDLNPYAVAIARFRLLLAALRVCEVRKLKNAPDFKIHLAVGDSLLHGRRFAAFADNTGPQRTFDTDELFLDELQHHYDVEDLDELHRILGQQYHAVVGNPPYITVSDSAISECYRRRYPSCHRQYSLSVPFMERFFDLAIKGSGTTEADAGFVGQITSNSFMKREFGKKLIENYIPRWDLTHIIDADKAHIPGHATPTVILLGRNQKPVTSTIRTVMGIKKEEPAPVNGASGLVWLAILSQVDQSGSESDFISVTDTPRDAFQKHPWSIGGGGVAELKRILDVEAAGTLGERIEDIGRTTHTGDDNAFCLPTASAVTHGLAENTIAFIRGEDVRDFVVSATTCVIFPYSEDGRPVGVFSLRMEERLWELRTPLKARSDFGQRIEERGLRWIDHSMFFPSRFRSQRFISFANVSTHNHFVFQAGASVFNSHAPAMQLGIECKLSDYYQLVGALNSSVACFWMKQVFHDKGAGGIGGGISAELWERRYEYDCTKLKQYPISLHLPLQLSSALVKTSTAMQVVSPNATLVNWGGPARVDIREQLATVRATYTDHRRQMIAWQEELDWQVYEAYGLLKSSDGVSLPEDKAVDGIPSGGIDLGQRAFEIVLARRMAAGEVQTTWFERHGSTPITELPAHWPVEYRRLVERRIARIESDANIRLIEQPEYKRRWNTEPWDDQLKRALCQWLLNRLEGYFFEGSRVCELKDGFHPAAHGFTAATGPHLVSTNQLAETVQSDPAFLQVAELYTGAPGFSVPKLIRELVEAESVPNLPVHRYKDSGLRHRRDWEQVWDLQRREDAVEEGVRCRVSGKREKLTAVEEELLKPEIRKAQLEQVGEVPVPPKYASKDFKKATYWKLRGKLDVPKERWVLYVGAEKDGDPSPMIAWAGWTHLQQAQALAEYYLNAKESQGWPPQKLKLLLSGLLDLLPWLKQWHNEVDPDLGMGLGDYFEGFTDTEARFLNLTVGDLHGYRFAAAVESIPDDISV